MEQPRLVHPQDHAVYSAEKMGKSTIFRSERILVGLNCFEAGQEHRLHTHEGVDKVYHVLSGRGLFLLPDREALLEEGLMLVVPAGVPHGIRNTSDGRLLVMTILAPPPA